MARVEEESRIVSSFGEYLVAFYLTKKGVHVIRSDTVVFDLLARDTRGELFPKDKLIGISVKTRSSVRSPSYTIPFPSFEKIPKFAEQWNLEPWLCCVFVLTTKKNPRLQCFLFPYEIAAKYMAQRKRKNVVSMSKMRKVKDSRIIKFEWKIPF